MNTYKLYYTCNILFAILIPKKYSLFFKPPLMSSCLKFMKPDSTHSLINNRAIFFASKKFFIFGFNKYRCTPILGGPIKGQFCAQVYTWYRSNRCNRCNRCIRLPQVHQTTCVSLLFYTNNGYPTPRKPNASNAWPILFSRH